MYHLKSFYFLALFYRLHIKQIDRLSKIKNFEMQSILKCSQVSIVKTHYDISFVATKNLLFGYVSLASGCDEYSNPTSSMLVLDKKYQRQGEQQIAVLAGTRNCFVLPN
jgi:hypothetical protein